MYQPGTGFLNLLPIPGVMTAHPLRAMGFPGQGLYLWAWLTLFLGVKAPSRPRDEYLVKHACPTFVLMRKGTRACTRARYQ